MIERLYIEATDETPEINFDKENNHLEVSGKSLPEDAIQFYEPVQEWLDKYILEPNPKTELLLKLEYFNSASAGKIMKLLITLETLAQQGKDVDVVWFYDEDDDLIRKRGQEIMEILNLKVTLKPFENN